MPDIKPKLLKYLGVGDSFTLAHHPDKTVLVVQEKGRGTLLTRCRIVGGVTPVYLQDTVEVYPEGRRHND